MDTVHSIFDYRQRKIIRSSLKYRFSTTNKYKEFYFIDHGTPYIRNEAINRELDEVKIERLILLKEAGYHYIIVFEV